MIQKISLWCADRVVRRTDIFCEKHKDLHWRTCLWRYRGICLFTFGFIASCAAYIMFTLLNPLYFHTLHICYGIMCIVTILCMYRGVDYACLYSVLVKKAAENGDSAAIREWELIKKDRGIS